METTNQAPLVVEQTYSAPAKAVWEALTDNAKMKQWYFDLKEFKAEPDFEFDFSGGPPEKTYLHKCVVKEVIPFKKLSHTWRYEGYQGDSLVIWELFDEGDQTKVRLTHAGLETFPDDPDFARSNFEMGWNHITGISLKEFLEQQAN